MNSFNFIIYKMREMRKEREKVRIRFSCATRQRISKTREINVTSSADLRIFIKRGIAPASLTAFWCWTSQREKMRIGMKKLIIKIIIIRYHHKHILWDMCFVGFVWESSNDKFLFFFDTLVSFSWTMYTSLSFRSFSFYLYWNVTIQKKWIMENESKWKTRNNWRKKWSGEECTFHENESEECDNVEETKKLIDWKRVSEIE